MGILGTWRALGATLGVAVAAGCPLLGGSAPAQASPCSCPAGYSVPSSLPVNAAPFCFSATLTPNQLACGGSSLIPTSKPFNFVTSLGYAPTLENYRLIEDATGQSNSEEFLDLLVPKGDVYDPNAPRLGMHVSPGPIDPIDASAGGGASVTRSSGYGVTDTMGLVAPGSIGPSIRDTSGNGGLNGTIDATRFFGLPANQSVVLGGFFDYRRDNVSLGSSPALAALAVGNAGSLQADTYTFGGTLFYRAGSAYLRGAVDYNFGHANEANGITAGTGNFSTSGYALDARLGNVFVLLNTTGVPGPGAMPTKAPPKPTTGYMVGLDLSGHLSYIDNWSAGFTDSSGFATGTGQTRFGDVGARAKFFVLAPSGGFLWMPYISGTVDQWFGFSSVLNIPSQAALATGDVVGLQVAQTYWGTDFGVDVRGPNGWTVGVKGFYQASTDTNIVGGNAYVKIPLNYTPRPAFAPRY